MQRPPRCFCVCIDIFPFVESLGLVVGPGSSVCLCRDFVFETQSRCIRELEHVRSLPRPSQPLLTMWMTESDIMHPNRMRSTTTRAPRRVALAAVAWVLAMTPLPPASAAPVSGQLLAMDQALWKYSGDRFHCKLELPADNIGQLAFVRNAGGDLRFVVETRLKAGH